jgi:predicted MFS family arabinose efflux permease
MKARAVWTFFLCFTLMLLDYMARQVVVAMFPVLKLQWSLTDAQLGALVSIVSLAVGALSIPLAILADRWSRVKAVAIMAVLWSAATAAGALAHSYPQLMVARFFVGIGEAAYGAAAASLISSAFPEKQRAAATGTFMSAALFGSVLGVLIGGSVGARHGWQAGFLVVGLPGLILGALFWFLREESIEPAPEKDRRSMLDDVVQMFRSPSVLAAYGANSILTFVAGTITAWLPTFFNRVYGLSTEKASVRAAGAILAAGIGSSIFGFLVDRLARRNRRALFAGPAAIAGGVALLLGAAFRLPAGPLQYGLILAGSLGLVSTQGPMIAVIASLVRPGIRSTAFAVLAVVQNVIGLAGGALVTGLLSDRLGIAGALAVVPIFALAAAVVFAAGARAYGRELSPRPEPAAHLHEEPQWTH